MTALQILDRIRELDKGGKDFWTQCNGMLAGSRDFHPVTPKLEYSHGVRIRLNRFVYIDFFHSHTGYFLDRSHGTAHCNVRDLQMEIADQMAAKLLSDEIRLLLQAGQLVAA